MTTQHQTRITSTTNIVFACEMYRAAVSELESAEAKIKAAKEQMKLHLKEEGLKKDEHQGLKFQMIDVSVVTTYDRKTLEILVPAEILQKAKKESLRDEYIRVMGT